MVKICSHCNAENPDTNVFCFSCGKVLTPSQQQSTIQNDIVCPSCRQATSSTFNNCPNCGAPLKQTIRSAYRQSQPPPSAPQQKTKGFKWWKLFTWPFACLASLFELCCGCCCGDCCETKSSSKSLKEEVADEVLDTVLDAFD